MKSYHWEIRNCFSNIHSCQTLRRSCPIKYFGTVLKFQRQSFLFFYYNDPQYNCLVGMKAEKKQVQLFPIKDHKFATFPSNLLWQQLKKSRTKYEVGDVYLF